MDINIQPGGGGRGRGGGAAEPKLRQMVPSGGVRLLIYGQLKLFFYHENIMKPLNQH